MNDVIRKGLSKEAREFVAIGRAVGWSDEKIIEELLQCARFLETVKEARKHD